jgi:hypothetical protein
MTNNVFCLAEISKIFFEFTVQIDYRLANRCFPPNFGSFWQSSFREDFQKATNLKQGLPVAAMFANGSKGNEQSLMGGPL